MTTDYPLIIMAQHAETSQDLHTRISRHLSPIESSIVAAQHESCIQRAYTHTSSYAGDKMVLHR
jgi:hypothetical protein